MDPIKYLVDDNILLGGAGAICVAVIAAPAVLGATVPTGALRHILGGLAGLRVSIKHISLAASKLVGLLKCVNVKLVSMGMRDLPCCGNRKSMICSQWGERR